MWSRSAEARAFDRSCDPMGVARQAVATVAAGDRPEQRAAPNSYAGPKAASKINGVNFAFFLLTFS